VLQCVAVCCSVLQFVGHGVLRARRLWIAVALQCAGSVLQQVAVCIAVCCSVLQRVVVCCSTFQCDAVCCSVLQCVGDDVLCACRL